MTHAICSESTGFLKKWFLFLLPTQAGQDSHSSTPATSSQLPLCAAQGDMAALSPNGTEKVSPPWKRNTKHMNHPAPCGRFWDTSCLFLTPRRFTEPKHESSLLQPCTAPLPCHQHPVNAGGCRADAPTTWAHLGSSCIRSASLIDTGWGPGARQE